MSLKIRLANINSPNDFTVSYKTGRTPGDVTIGFTSYGSTYSGGTTEVIVSGISLNFETQYWFKITDTVTSGYNITNIYTHDDCYFPCGGVSPTPTVTPTQTIGTTPPVTPSITPTITETPSITPTITETPSITPSETPTSTPPITPSLTPSETPAITPSVTPTVTPTDSPVATPSPTPTPSADITTEVQTELYAISSGITYEVTYENDACYYSGNCFGGRQILYTSTNAISGCTVIGSCIRNTTIRTGGGDIYITWQKSRNASGSCSSGPCYADDSTIVRVYIDIGSGYQEATSFGSPWQYDGPSAPGGAQLVTDSVLLTGITYTDKIRLYIGEG